MIYYNSSTNKFIHKNGEEYEQITQEKVKLMAKNITSISNTESEILLATIQIKKNSLSKEVRFEMARTYVCYDIYKKSGVVMSPNFMLFTHPFFFTKDNLRQMIFPSVSKVHRLEDYIKLQTTKLGTKSNLKEEISNRILEEINTVKLINMIVDEITDGDLERILKTTGKDREAMKKEVIELSEASLEKFKEIYLRK